MSFSLLISTLEVLNHHKKALKYAKEWSLREANNTNAQITYANLLSHFGDTTTAITLLERVHLYDSNKPFVPLAIAKVLHKTQQYDKSLRYIDKAIELFHKWSLTITQQRQREILRNKKEESKSKDNLKKLKKLKKSGMSKEEINKQIELETNLLQKKLKINKNAVYVIMVYIKVKY